MARAAAARSADIAGEGHAARNASARLFMGDAAPNEFRRRRVDNDHVQLSLSMAQCALAGRVSRCAASPAWRLTRQPTAPPRGRPSRSARVSAASSDVDVLASELVSAVAARPANDARVLELIDALAAARAPVNPAAFDGAFEVVWSEGTMAWRALVAGAIQRVAGKCRAGQQFRFGGVNAALNFAELFGGAVTITAEGVFRPVAEVADTENPNALSQDARHPLGFEVQIAGGDVSAFGRTLSLPICGPGEFEVLYSDENVRVFKSAGGIAVQRPSDWRRDVRVTKT